MSKLEYVANTYPHLKKGDKIRLIDGDKIQIDGVSDSYRWDNFEEIAHIEGDIIFFKGFPFVRWYTTHMPWEVEGK